MYKNDFKYRITYTMKYAKMLKKIILNTGKDSYTLYLFSSLITILYAKK